MTADAVDEGRHGAVAPVRASATLPAVEDSLEAVHALVSGVWDRASDVDDTERMLFETAVMEIAGNVVEHGVAVGGRIGAVVTFTLTVICGHDRIVALFEDDGKPAEVDLTQVSMPDDLSESGRGLALAQAVLDDLTFERADGSNRWRLVRLRG
ncbi:ATP-binding protein [Clavibacter sp. MX14-G9D]|uniref:ATP-binding protein n=1 Tax=Clavibacter sp. MX14-G9D TaxID=3064656 RepID=UPI00293E44DA|nr:ATP-binding protein [Clavibacter sp. MX14-G9D]